MCVCVRACAHACACVCVRACVCACVCARAPAIVLSMGTKFVNKEEIVCGTRRKDSVTLHLSLLRVSTMKMYSNLCFNVFVYFLLV